MTENLPAAPAQKPLAPPPGTPYVTTLRSIEIQVGEHVIATLQGPDTVAVISAVVVGRKGGQHIVSTPLDQEMLAQVQQMMHATSPERRGRTRCVGFHCHIEDPDE